MRIRPVRPRVSCCSRTHVNPMHRVLHALPLILAAAGVQAHDLWFEVANHEPAVGQAVGITVRIGENFKGDPIGMSGVPIKELFIADGAGRRPVAVLRGAKPALLVRVQRPGTQVLAYRSHPIDISIPGETFHKYLAEEGLQAIADERIARGEAGAEAREAYVRCAKALLLAGGADPATAVLDQTLGLPLELVALDPIDAGTREARLRLLFDGKPIAGVLVMALPESNPKSAQRIRSDANGEVRFRLEPGTRWLVKAVHMQAAPASVTPTAPQWLSWWASLTFTLPGSRAAPGKPLS